MHKNKHMHGIQQIPKIKKQNNPTETLLHKLIYPCSAQIKGNEAFLMNQNFKKWFIILLNDRYYMHIQPEYDHSLMWYRY